VYQRTPDNSLGKQSQFRGSFDFCKDSGSISVLLIVVPEYGVDIQSSGDPFAVHQAVGCESHSDKSRVGRAGSV
jgi:hypothetical protein